MPSPEHLFLDEKCVLLDVPGNALEPVAASLVEHLVRLEVVAPEHAQELTARIVEREQSSSAAVGEGVFLPHVYAEFVKRPVVLFARLHDGLELNSPDEQPCELVFLLVGRRGEQDHHLDTLTQITRLLQNGQFRSVLEQSSSQTAIIESAQSAVDRLRAPVLDSAALARAGLEERTGRLMGGVLADVRRRLPSYADDFLQGLNLKSLATTIFLFFACFTAAVTFGALMDAETGGAIGAVDMLLATAVCGVVYALVSGQPLIILGGTGPLLVFTALLYQLTGQFEAVDFLPFYAWVGIWAATITVILAVTDASVWIRYFTRFTDEIFVLLIAAIFIVEALRLLATEFEHDSALINYATAISAVVLAVGTFGVAIALRQIRKSTLLRRWTRNFLADFGVVIAIAAMSVVAHFMRETTELPHISVPTDISFNPADHLVSVTALPGWAIAAAAVPGAFAAILIFLDQQITARVVNAPQFNLQKGPGYHLDLLVVGLLVGFCSLLGWPWLVAATVRSLNHVAALSTTHAESRPGRTQVVTDRVVENRVTGVAIHLMIGLSVLLVPILALVPMACLYGIFLYMGIASLSGNQMFQRVTLWVRDPELYPRTHYLRRVPTRVVHKFTAVQVVCLAVLWLVKTSMAAILFPLVLAMLVPVRLLLPRFFDQRHLQALDAEETPEEEAEREAAP